MSRSLNSVNEFSTALSHPGIVIVKYQGSFCQPCHFIQPLYDKFASEFAERAQFFTVEADDPEFDDIVAEFGVEGIPAFHVFVNGQLVEKLIGANPMSLESLVKKYAR